MPKKKAGTSDVKKTVAALEKAHKDLALHIKNLKTAMGHGFVGSSATGHPHGAAGAQVKGHPFVATGKPKGAQVKGHPFKAGGKP